MSAVRLRFSRIVGNKQSTSVRRQIVEMLLQSSDEIDNIAEHATTGLTSGHRTGRPHGTRPDESRPDQPAAHGPYAGMRPTTARLPVRKHYRALLLLGLPLRALIFVYAVVGGPLSSV